MPEHASPRPPTASAMSRALRRARDSVTLNPAEAEVLLQASGADLAALLDAAGRVRDAGLIDAGRPGVITYSPKVFIPLTHLCRDRCHYCTFVTTPGGLKQAGKPVYMSPDEVLEVARAGAEAGCLEALFTLGDRPETRWPQAREWLDAHGYDDTLSYVRAMAVLVLEETGLLPHLNPGVMTWQELARLKPVAPSMGMMLETSSTRLWAEPGGPHFGSPDKEPAVRLRVLEDAGRLAIPFTTGILVGIGETAEERAQSIFDIRRIARTYHGIQEVIVQNFRAKPDTAMRSHDDADRETYLAAIAVTRLVLGPKARVQAPPNLSDPDELAALVRAGIDDWGGVSPVTPDHVNPERPWPHLDELRARTNSSGFELRARLTIHPSYVRAGEPWVDARVRRHVAALSAADGLARVDARPQGLPWQEDDAESYTAFASNGSGHVDLFADIDVAGRTDETRSDFADVYGDWSEIQATAHSIDLTAPTALVGAVSRALSKAADDPQSLTDDDALALMTCEGSALDELARIADDLRRDRVGDTVTYVVNRNINFTNVCYTGCRFCAFAQRRTDADAYTLSLDEVAQRAAIAAAAGATEVCLQGGIHPDLPGTAYFDLVRAIKARVPGMHVHAFSPMEVVNGASRSNLSIREWLQAAQEAGLDTIPGTAAEILDDEVRWVLTKGKLPTASWVEVVTTAHELGIRSSSTMMYGHVDHPKHWVAHLRLLARLQDQTGGFTEFVALPFIHHSAPVYLAGIARPGPTMRDNIAVHAMARLLLDGRIEHVQTSWVKLGDDGCVTMLRSGADDLGGTLMEETISRMAGSEHGSARDPEQLRAIAAKASRPSSQRTTTYQPVARSAA